MNAAAKYLIQPADKQTTVTESGAMIVTPEALARFGGGDARIGRKELRALLAADREGRVQKGPTQKPDSVRLAGPADEKEVLELLLCDLAVNAAHIATISEDRIMAAIQVGTRNRGGFVGVIGKPIVAVTIIHPVQWWFSNGWYMQEIVNYVHADHRRSRYADDLMDFMKWTSDSMSKGMGYTLWLACGVFGAWRIHAKTALYRRRFCQAGSAFIYPAPPMRGN